ncbi:methylenetetrahydrofolate reductase [Nesterenkonia sp. NBAIMH1]|uniref:methylenetetrahydrofolate reductase n=1 Tax=Nesterenkonia sp. NBAIMH1 TaxID=2600320 RepID=UPI0011B4F683|nr:methylenetetrahydrofolate reductase [Nesterenkonia sp. NBAIMH1]
MARSLATNEDERRTLHTLAHNLSYEVMPFKTAVEKVRAHVPTEVPLTVTATGGKGLEPTLDVSAQLAGSGYSVAPHVPARLVSGPDELNTIVERLEAAGIDRLFVIGGDAEEPAGEFHEALDLLRALDERGHHFVDIGIGGYPEGHAFFDDAVIGEALRRKAAHSHRILTQICFDPDAYIKWGTQLRQEGVDLPVYAGVPGPVSRQKLMRISASLGLGPSANFLKKQQNMLWKFFTPSGYRPTALLRGLVQKLHTADTRIAGLHIYTFNDLERTEAWRQELLAQARG